MRYIGILILSTVPLSAAAQGFEGAVVDLQYQKYDDGQGFEVDSLEGAMDAAWSFGTFGAQVGLALGKEIDSSEDIDFRQYNGLALHATADVSDSFRVGAMLAADNQADEIYLYAAEALYLAGPVRVEGRVGDSLEKDEPYSLFEVQGSYAIGDAFSARARMHFSDFGPAGDYRVFSLGAGYALSEGAQVYADISRHKNDFGPVLGEYSGNIVSLGVRFDLGGEGDRLFSFQPLN